MKKLPNIHPGEVLLAEFLEPMGISQNALALVALRAHGYRPAQSRGHRTIVFQTLPLTLGADESIWVTLDKAHTRRNASEYEGIIEASDTDATDLALTAQKLYDLLTSWIQTNRPELA